MEVAEKFAVIRASGRYWTVGAVHSEADRLHDLHRRMEQRLKDNDKLVYLGNFLGIGAAAVETVDEMLLFRRRFLARPRAHIKDYVILRGAQEEIWQKLLQIHLALNPGEVLNWMMEHGAGPTMQSYGADPEGALAAVHGGVTALNRWASSLRDRIRSLDGHAALIASLRRAAYGDDGGMLFVHSGLDPARPITSQADDFWWNSQGFDEITAPYGTYRRIVRGHDPRGGGVQINPYTATIDGGCGHGGNLVAACFDPLGEMVDLIEA